MMCSWLPKPRPKPSAKPSCFSRITRTAARLLKRSAGQTASFVARLATPTTSPIWRAFGAISATPNIPRRSSRSKSEPSSKIRPSVWKSGCQHSGCSPTARAASAATNWPARSASPKRPHGSCCRASNSRAGSTVYPDFLLSHDRLDSDYTNRVIDHAEAYVDGEVHTNSCENFWSLLKCAIKGTYVSIELFHLFRYLDEQAFRFNNRV